MENNERQDLFELNMTQLKKLAKELEIDDIAGLKKKRVELISPTLSILSKFSFYLLDFSVSFTSFSTSSMLILFFFNIG